MHYARLSMSARLFIAATRDTQKTRRNCEPLELIRLANARLHCAARLLTAVRTRADPMGMRRQSDVHMRGRDA